MTGAGHGHVGDAYPKRCGSCLRYGHYTTDCPAGTEPISPTEIGG